MYESNITYRVPKMCAQCLHGGDARSPLCSCPDPKPEDIEEHSNSDLFGQIEVVIPVGFAKNEEEEEKMQEELGEIFKEKDILYITTDRVQGPVVKFPKCSADAEFKDKEMNERKNTIRAQVMKWFSARPMKEYLKTTAPGNAMTGAVLTKKRT